MDHDVIRNKLESLRRCILRVQEKTPTSSDALLEDYDIQDIIMLNLERAVQICVDMGLHILSETECPAPETMAQTFEQMNKLGMLNEALARRMIKSVGFRNTAVHAYQEVDWQIVYRIITEHLDDFRQYAKQVNTLLAQ